ncbi:hypothetical protein G3N96_37030 [Burkholderia sp. Se-20373]|nr:hypothetical protein [Burkholderia sp. Se-20373]
MSRQIRIAFRTAATAVSVVVVLSACVIGPTRSASPWASPQVVAAQRDANDRYMTTLTSFVVFASKAKADSRAKILEGYQGVLYQYSLASVSYVQAVYPTLQTLPPSLQPLPAPSGTPTVADLDRDYEHVLGMRSAMWDIGVAAMWGKKTKMSIPRYNGPTLSMPVFPPMPPFQDARDPKYARLAALTKQLDDAQNAEFEEQRQVHSREVARAINAPGAMSPAPAPQQPQGVQRWCTQSGGGVTGRVPC